MAQLRVKLAKWLTHGEGCSSYGGCDNLLHEQSLEELYFYARNSVERGLKKKRIKEIGN